MRGERKSLDPQLWHACAGTMVQIPPINSVVFYFPQGHLEHSQTNISYPKTLSVIPSHIPCRVASISYLADAETDEVYAKIAVVPLRNPQLELEEKPAAPDAPDGVDKPTSFAKTLTQSDANNGGGFSVPRYCAETIFPRLDYTAEPPVQTVVARDVHGEVWKFRHIYRGTPRRHLLTTGWSTFVNQKKLIAGDSIVFLRAEDGELRVGIRRVKRTPAVKTQPLFGSALWFEDEEKRTGRIQEVLQATVSAVNGNAFEVLYYPRASTPEFLVKAGAVRDAVSVRWCPGMRFKMAFETEDSSRISWFMGTVSSANVTDPIRWPNSPWRLLQVTWDEPDLLQNVKRVNPWLVEVVSSAPMIHVSAYSPPRKKHRHPPRGEPWEGQIQLSSTIAPGVQGTRHKNNCGTLVSDLSLSSKLQSGLYLSANSPPGNSNKKSKKEYQFLLFGQPILTEQQLAYPFR